MPVSVSVKNGEVTLDIEGMCGQGCKNVMEAVTKAAQLNVTSEDPKDEFFAEQTNDATQQEGQ